MKRRVEHPTQVRKLLNALWITRYARVTMRAARIPLMLLVACGSSASDIIGTATVAATFDVRPGVEIATVTLAEPLTPLTLYDGKGAKLVTIIADEHGQAHFAYVPAEHIVLESGEGSKFPVVDGTTLEPGFGYVIQDNSQQPPMASEPFSVLHVHDVPNSQPVRHCAVNPVARTKRERTVRSS